MQQLSDEDFFYALFLICQYTKSARAPTQYKSFLDADCSEQCITYKRFEIYQKKAQWLRLDFALVVYLFQVPQFFAEVVSNEVVLLK